MDRERKIPPIQKIEFNVLYVFILGTRHFFNTYREAFKHRKSFQDLLCYRDYEEQVAAIFHTKSNPNTTAAIYMCLSKVLCCST